MKIACVAPDDLSTLIFCKTMSRAISERDDLELITISGVDRYREELKEVQSTHLEIGTDRFISPLRDLAYLFRLYRAFRREKCSAVITFTTKPNIYGSLAARLAGVPMTIMAVRGLGRAFEETTTLRDRVLLRVVSGLYRVAAKAANLVWFTNPKDQQMFVENGIAPQRKTFLTRNALDLTDFTMGNIEPARLDALRGELGIAEGDLIVIMVARLIWSKGVREFCEAAVMLRESHPNLHFILAAPEEPTSLDGVPPSYVHEMEAKSRLQWLGFRKDIRELYALSDLATLPSYYKEGGYPRALLEPMAYAKPVIAADTDDCRGPVEEGKNGFLVPPRDSAALASAIETIVSDPDQRRELGEHSLTRVRELFDDRPIFEELIDRVLQGAR